MKKQFTLKRGMVIVASALLIGTVFLSSCKKDNNSKTMYTVSGNANSSQVVPSVTDSGTAAISGTYDASKNILNYTISWSKLTGSPSGVGFYGGAASGANGTQVGNNVTITTAGTTGSAVGTMTLTDSQESDLLAGKWYYLITTPVNTHGEVRGQITTTAQ